MSVLSILCGCGQRFRHVRDFSAHRESASCPANAPESSKMYATWAMGAGHETITRPRTEEERQRREEKAERDRERLEALKNDPEVQERVRLKRERAKEVNRRRREMAGR